MNRRQVVYRMIVKDCKAFLGLIACFFSTNALQQFHFHPIE
ncbi:predicted protein [Plenodomus lingam JN3]|uniref:Predicted protein n=1 Tax=Leptosphaeria maculans (strain JN3 / isolate v23.1.3 / race Av1-4-5-6-7-8) TaxID=985895 RepID=E4ZME2_LEPMJ|nr:predicted protein [Plenodomus lingam JN3]CBX92491.1 predicted protein [Plenodomus lingam JN3]